MIDGVIHQQRRFNRIYGKDKVSGVSSAASIWNTGAIGAIGLAMAFDRFEIAFLLAVLNVLTLFFFGKVKKTVQGEDDDE